MMEPSCGYRLMANLSAESKRKLDETSFMMAFKNTISGEGVPLPDGWNDIHQGLIARAMVRETS